MRPKVGRSPPMVVWLAVACLELLPLSPLPAKQPKPRHTLKGHAGKVYSLAFSPDGKTLASAGKAVQLWDVASGKKKATLLEDPDDIASVAFSPDGTTLASAGKEVQLWDVASGKKKATLKGHCDTVLSVAFSPHGKMLTSGS